MSKPKTVILKVVTERDNEDDQESSSHEPLPIIRQEVDKTNMSDNYVDVKSKNIKTYKKVYKKCKKVMKNHEKLTQNSN